MYDLVPFFNEWGLQPTDDTKNKINDFNLKGLTKSIWDNIANLSTESNPIVQEKI